MLKSWIIICGLSLVLAGCGTSSNRVGSKKALPPDWDSELAVEPEPEQSSGIDSRRVTPLPLRSPPPVAPATGMIALSVWAAQHGFGPVQVTSVSPKPPHSLETPYGRFSVRPDSLSAFWDRMEIRLGFEPKLVGSEIFLNAIDLKKVLGPLAQGISVVTPRDRLVVIDPGHGGGNTGTRNVLNGRHEKEYTLDWARRLAPLLERSGWRVLLTRTNDTELTLGERVAFANAHEADLFISLHFNSAGANQSAAGLETYCITPTGMPSSLTRDYDDDPDQVFPNNTFDTQNLRYAVRLHQSLLLVNGGRDRGVRWARFMGVLQGQQQPAVLLEGGFLSNPEEARKLEDPAYRQLLAEAVARALQ